MSERRREEERKKERERWEASVGGTLLSFPLISRRHDSPSFPHHCHSTTRNFIDFQAVWGLWTETIAWRLEQNCPGIRETTPGMQLRERIFHALGYDWRERRVEAGETKTGKRNIKNSNFL